MKPSSLRHFVARGEDLPLGPATRASLRGCFLRLSDGVTHYELSGPPEGELVLLVPGLTIPLFYWDALAAQLHEQGLRTLAYSAYGRGYSDRVVSTYEPAMFVRQAQELVQGLGLAGVDHVIGTSLGALIAMRLLRETWCQPQTLTLVGPAGLGSRLPLPARLSRWNGVAEVFGRYLGRRGVLAHLDHNVLEKEHARELKRLVGEAYRYHGSVYALFATLRSFPLLDQQPLYEATGRLPIARLLLWGENDRVTPITGLRIAADLLKPDQCHVIPRCGHMAPFERPEEVARRFADFRSRISIPYSASPIP